MLARGGDGGFGFGDGGGGDEEIVFGGIEVSGGEGGALTDLAEPIVFASGALEIGLAEIEFGEIGGQLGLEIAVIEDEDDVVFVDLLGDGGFDLADESREGDAETGVFAECFDDAGGADGLGERFVGRWGWRRLDGGDGGGVADEESEADEAGGGEPEGEAAEDGEHGRLG